MPAVRNLGEQDHSQKERQPHRGHRRGKPDLRTLGEQDHAQKERQPHNEGWKDYQAKLMTMWGRRIHWKVSKFRMSREDCRILSLRSQLGYSTVCDTLIN